MKPFLMLCMCITLLGSSVGCCWMNPCGGGACGSCSGGACGQPNYFGGGFPTGAYSGGTSMTAAMPMTTSYAMSPNYPVTAGAYPAAGTYPVTAGLPINSLPTY